MERSAEKTILLTNGISSIQREIKMKGQKLETVTSFKYLGAIFSDDGLKPGGFLKDLHKPLHLSQT